jgi:phosphoribosylanthranilate isomerase
VLTDVKFCGLTRAEDLAMAHELEAAFVGMIFTRGPRRVDVERALEISRDVAVPPRRVGVFGAEPMEWILETARDADLDVIQLHADPSPAQVRKVCARFEGSVWAAVRISGRFVPPNLTDLFDASDAVVLDARPQSHADDAALGGTGMPFDWAAVVRQVESARADTGVSASRLVLAGGLTPENVAEAVRLLAPEVVDVSSGVEREPGIKDHERMRAFTLAVQGASTT